MSFTNAHVNVANCAPSRSVIATGRYQQRLRRWMVETNDHCIAAFDVRDDSEQLAEQIRNYRPQIKQPKQTGKQK